MAGRNKQKAILAAKLLVIYQEDFTWETQEERNELEHRFCQLTGWYPAAICEAVASIRNSKRQARPVDPKVLEVQRFVQAQSEEVQAAYLLGTRSILLDMLGI